MTSLVGMAIRGARAMGEFAAEVHDLDKQARSLGVTVNDLQAAKILGAGVGGGMMQGLGALSQTMNAARAGMPDAQRLMGAAGIEGGGNLLETFAEAAERIRAIKDPARQAAQAYLVFGDAAADLLPMLRDGHEGMSKMAEAAKRLGLAVDANDARNMRHLAQASAEMAGAWKGLQNQAMLGLAPVFAELRGVMSSLVNFDGLKKTILDIAHGVAQAGAAVVAAFDPTTMGKLWEAFFGTLKAHVKAFIGEVLLMIGDAYAVVNPKNWFGGNKHSWIDIAGMKMVQQGDRDMLAANAAWSGATERIGASGPMQWVNALFGRAKARMDAPMLPGAAGVAEGFIRGVVGKFMGGGGGGGGMPGLGGPGDDFRQKMAELAQMGKLGLGGGGVLSSMFGKAGMDLISGAGVAQYRAGGAALGNTREAYSAIAQAERTQRRDPVDLIRAALDADAKRQEAQIQIGRDIEAAVKANRINLKRKEV
jgi:hypothetical protein